MFLFCYITNDSWTSSFTLLFYAPPTVSWFVIFFLKINFLNVKTTWIVIYFIFIIVVVVFIPTQCFLFLSVANIFRLLMFFVWDILLLMFSFSLRQMTHEFLFDCWLSCLLSSHNSSNFVCLSYLFIFFFTCIFHIYKPTIDLCQVF